MDDKFPPDNCIPDMHPFLYGDIIPEDGILYDAVLFEYAAPAD